MKNRKTISIGIIGGGAAGTCTAHYLIKELRGNISSTTIKIDIFEKRGNFGPGLAFECDNDTLLMNMVTQDISLFMEETNDFWKWLSRTSHQEYKQYMFNGNAIAPNGFVPRGLFGKYMRFKFEQVNLEAKNVGIILNRQPTEIRHIFKSDVYNLITNTGDVNSYDLIVLCTGNPEPSDIFDLSGHSRYINTPYPVQNYINKIPKDDSVGLIGSQLTATDVAIVLAQNGHKGPIKMLSRTPELPVIRSVVRPYTLLHLNLTKLNSILKKNNNITLRCILRLLRKELSLIKVDWRDVIFRSKKEIAPEEYFKQRLSDSTKEEAWQSILVATDHVIEHYWHFLSRRDKDYFMDNIHRRWNSSRAPLPATTAYKLNYLILEGQLSFCSGLKNISISHTQKFIAEISEGEKAKFNKRARQNFLEFDWLINATGPARHINDSVGGIYSDLIESGLAQKDKYGGIKVVFETSAVINSLGYSDETLYAVGQPANGTYYFVSSLEMISLRSKSTAKAISKKITKSLIH